MCVCIHECVCDYMCVCARACVHCAQCVTLHTILAVSYFSNILLSLVAASTPCSRPPSGYHLLHTVLGRGRVPKW